MSTTSYERMGCNMKNVVDNADLHHPEANQPVESGVRIEGEDVVCPVCSKPILFTESAVEEISFVRMCEVTQTIFDCQHCGVPLIIFPKGDISTKVSEGELVVGPPSDGFYIARLPEEIS